MQNRHYRVGVDLNTCCWGWSVAKLYPGKGMSNNKDNEGIDVSKSTLLRNICYRYSCILILGNM